MPQRPRSTWARCVIAVTASVLAAAFMLLVRPFPTDVFAQQPSTVAQPVIDVRPLTPTGSAPTISVSPARPVAPAVAAPQPVAVPRTGAGITADRDLPLGMGMAAAVVAFAAAFGSTAYVVRLRQGRR